MDKEFTVYMRWVAIELRKQGFKIKRTGINPNKPQFDTYIFDYTPEFKEALTRLTAQHHNKS